MNRAIRCFAEGRAGQWEAVCVDLDIAVQGESFQEVYDDLNKAIVMYMDRVADLPADEQRAFLNRRAPWRLRAGAVLLNLIAALCARRPRDGKDRAGFTMRCPA